MDIEDFEQILPCLIDQGYSSGMHVVIGSFHVMV